MSDKFDFVRFKKVQENLPNVPKGGKGNFGAYMKLEDLNPKLIKLLNDNGFVWVTGATAIDGQPALYYAVVDVESGEKIEGTMLLAMDKNTPQGQGSAITYARRYALCSVTGIVADMDDDGHKASQVVTDTPKRIFASEKQINLILSKMKERGSETKEDAIFALSTEFGVPDIAKLTMDDASVLIEELIG